MTQTIKKTVDAFMGVNDGSGAIGVAGDWHGNAAWAEQALGRLHQAEISVVMHLGDFGVWPGAQGEEFLDSVNRFLRDHEMFLFVTLGNHEDYNQISGFEPVEGMPGCVFSFKHENIVFLSRGFVWQWHQKRFMSFGGANSIDKLFRKINVNWWPQEQISDQDVSRGESAGDVDVMFTHDVPYGVDVLGSHRSVRLPVEVQQYVDQSRIQLKQVVDVVKPSWLFHGHFHVYRDQVDVLRVYGEYDYYRIRCVGLDKEYTDHNIGVFDVKNMDFQII